MISLRCVIPLLVCLVLLRGLPGWSAPPDAQQQQIDQLIRQLGSDRFEERERAVKDLVAVGAPALEPLRRALDSPDLEVVRRARECIPQIERNVKVAACIKDLLEGKTPKVRADATGYLAQLGPAAAAAVPALIHALDDVDAYVRERAVITLKLIGPESKPAVPKLTQSLQNKKEKEDLRRYAVLALEEIGPGAVDAVPTLLWVLERENDRLKQRAADALGLIGGDHPKMVPALLETLKHPNPYIRGTAAIALGRLGREPATCVPALVQVLKQQKRTPIAQPDTRPEIMAALVLFGRHARPAVPVLLEIAKDDKEDSFFRTEAIKTFERLGPVAKDAVPFLETLMLKDHVYREEATQALQAILQTAKNFPFQREVTK